MITSLLEPDRRTVLKHLGAILPVSSVPTLPGLARDVAAEVSNETLDIERMTASRAFEAVSERSKYALVADSDEHTIDELPDRATIEGYLSQHTWASQDTENGPTALSDVEIGVCHVALLTFDVTSPVDARRAWYDTMYDDTHDHVMQHERSMQIDEHRDAIHPAFYARIPGRNQYDVVFHAGPNWILTIEAQDTRRGGQSYDSIAADHYEWLTSTEFASEAHEFLVKGQWETVDPTV